MKRRESLSARLGDVLSELYLMSCTLKRYEDENCSAADLPLVEWNYRNALHNIQTRLDEVLANLTAEDLKASATPLSPLGVRLPARISLGDHAGFRDGLFEVQDEASQLCAQLVDAKPGTAAMDLCAGAGGKTLAIAATMATGSATIKPPHIKSDIIKSIITGPELIGTSYLI